MTVFSKQRNRDYVADLLKRFGRGEHMGTSGMTLLV